MEPIRGEIQAVFFDLDGTLVDSEPLQLEAIRKILAAYGIAVDERDYYHSLLPLSYRETAESLLGAAGLKLPAPALDEIAVLIEREARLRMLRFARPEPPAIECVCTAAGLGPVGLVTSTPRSIVDPLLDGWALHGRFQVIVCGEDTPRGKPAPEPYFRALELARTHTGRPIPATSCLVFEDSPHGVESALAAGMRTVGVATRIAPERLRAAERVVERLSPDLLPRRSPLD
jgi:HAD superfamily hydrolase (TIGR01509 family)